MTDTPIADAFQEWRHRIRENPDRDVFYSDPTLVWMECARALLAQMKPFLDAYHEWESQVEPNQSVIINRVLKTYQSHVKPLLKELEE